MTSEGKANQNMPEIYRKSQRGTETPVKLHVIDIFKVNMRFKPFICCWFKYSLSLVHV